MAQAILAQAAARLQHVGMATMVATRRFLCSYVAVLFAALVGVAGFAEDLTGHPVAVIDACRKLTLA